jgi:hypothetical protein
VVGFLFAALLAIIVGGLLKSYFEIRDREEEKQSKMQEAELRWAEAEGRHKARVELGLEPDMNCDGCGQWLGPDISLEDVCCAGCGQQFHPGCKEKHWEQNKSCYEKRFERL